MEQNKGNNAQKHANEEAQQRFKDVEKEEGRNNTTREANPVLKREQRDTYREALRTLHDSGVTYAVGAAFARHVYTSIWRPTKDLDIFVKPEDLRKAMDALESVGFNTEVKERIWLAKAWKDGYFIDLIFGTGNGHVPIDDGSFEGSQREIVLGVEVDLMPIEEMIATAAYVAGRNRFDGGEIVHLIRSAKGKLDWQRILRRLGENGELLFWHLILFDFIYPGHSNYLPKELMTEMFEEIRQRWEKERRRHSRAFRGTLLDPYHYTVDVKDWDYEDRRNTDPLVDKEGNVVK